MYSTLSSARYAINRWKVNPKRCKASPPFIYFLSCDFGCRIVYRAFWKVLMAKTKTKKRMYFWKGANNATCKFWQTTSRSVKFNTALLTVGETLLADKIKGKNLVRKGVGEISIEFLNLCTGCSVWVKQKRDLHLVPSYRNCISSSENTICSTITNI